MKTENKRFENYKEYFDEIKNKNRYNKPDKK